MKMMLMPLLVFGFNVLLSCSVGATAFWPGKGTPNDTIYEPSLRLKTIVIDAGHGGKDPGCSGAHSREKHIALALAQTFAGYLREAYPDLKVILTRDDDVFIPLHERAAIANRAKADLFVSIHCNFMPGSSATRGTETYVMGLHTAEHNLNVAKRENESILLEADYQKNYDYDPNTPEGHILLSMFQNTFLEQSIRFAEKLEHHFDKTAQRRSRGVRQAGFVVLKETTMPSVLVESGFLSNSEEEDFLLTAAGQQQVATAMLLAFAEYKSEWEGTPLPLAFHPAGEDEKPLPPPRAVLADYQPSPRRATPATPTSASASTVASTTTSTSPSEPRPPLSTYRALPVSEEASAVPATDYSATAAPAAAAADRGPVPARTNVAPADYQICVQVAASKRPLAGDDRWQKAGHTIEQVEEASYYKYQVRNLASLREATAVQAQLRGRGFPDAFVVVYKNGERIGIDQAQRELASR